MTPERADCGFRPARADAVHWLHLRGAVYLRCGQHRRGLVYLLMAHRLAPTDCGVLRTLVVAYTADGDRGRASSALERLAQLDVDAPYVLWLRSHVLWSSGEREAARLAFGTFIQARGVAACSPY